MKLVKRPRASAKPKLQKGLTAKGGEYYFSKRPSQRRADYVDSKAKPATPEKTIRIKRK